jgi:hypothetical protein
MPIIGLDTPQQLMIVSDVDQNLGVALNSLIKDAEGTGF